ncbi:Septum formation [Actinomadura meyerae]|uniref:Septum formation n=1 Tax=Actinomadura meyerae TaxID=240840 RepID=A0A239BY89_9ACTN|nr:septum formation family protein [Actinomadura meyerae]SNS12622.1 Septum formation [Actinomadura meyerae]
MTTPPSADDLPDDPSPAAPRRTNRLSTATLVTGLLVLVLSAAGVTVAAVLVAHREPEPARPIDTHGKTWASELRAGDCFSALEEQATRVLVEPSPCARPHDGEVGAELTLPAADFPGDRAVAETARKECAERTRFLRQSVFGNRLELYADRPDEKAWKDGDRDVLCLLRYPGPQRLTAPLVDTKQTELVPLARIGPGDCLTKWQISGFLPLIDCRLEHRFEVYAVFTLPDGAWPGDEAVARAADEGCRSRWDALFGPAGPRLPDGRRAGRHYEAPVLDHWKKKNRQVTCLVTGTAGPLRGSVVPR